MQRAICSNCRRKKIRCDGGQPVCGACTRSRKYVPCNYDAIDSESPVQSSAFLRKGEACTACRRKKKKCDGHRPTCRTCIVARKEDQCQYDDALCPETSLLEGAHGHVAGPQPYEFPSFPSHSDGGGSSSATCTSSPSPITSDAPPLDTLTDDARCSIVPSDVLDFTAIFDPANIASKDASRRLFIAHGLQLGLCLSNRKLDALRAGDLSGAVLQPAMVHIAHLWGHVLWQLKHSVSRPDVELRLCNIAVDALTNTFQPPPSDTMTWLNAYALMGLYFFRRREICRGREFMLKASNAVLELNLHISFPLFKEDTRLHSTHGFDDAEEQIGVLCQLLYVDKSSELLLHVPPLFNSQLDTEFQAACPPTLCWSGLVILRLGSVSLLHEARGLLRNWTDWGFGEMPHVFCASHSSPWYTKYWSLLERLHRHLGNLDSLLIRSSFGQESHAVQQVLKLCILVTLAALAELHHLFVSLNPESRRRCTDISVKIVSMTSTFENEEIRFLDPVVLVGESRLPTPSGKLMLSRYTVFVVRGHQDSFARRE
ncbi:hypothetical protein F5I97DRAFT_1806245 [Phlebopus sp. FC_14]|nr:hypothetical protein F5I97DRAFT_1806245 [Phlebopus sp. FC_14]